MAHDLHAHLWSNNDDHFFRDLCLSPQRQTGPRCVPTSLAILTQQTPETFAGKINTQDPVSWSSALRPYGMKLAYCPTDVRKVKFYVPDLRALDDLFTVSYYTAVDSADVLADPRPDGWAGGSHVVVVHRDSVLDPASGTCFPLSDFERNHFHTKRIFRVVPADHPRGL